MPPTTVEVIAPSRLHFGLQSFGQSGTRQYGGAGVMVSRPGLHLRVSPAAAFDAIGPLAARATAVVERYRQLMEIPHSPACRIEILTAPPEHVGLGTGTQLALSVVAAVHAFRGGEDLVPSVLAAIAGRGVRSAIGTYGFAFGGLLVETGKFGKQLLAPLETRVELPAAWRFVLVTPHGEQGPSGDLERGAFEDLPPVPRSTTAALLNELSEELIPAAIAGDFDRFSASLFRYGHAAGMCFAAKQGGPFAGPQLASLVDAIRAMGVAGVGQTSWGPTLFALLPTVETAGPFARQIRERLGPSGTVTVAEPSNAGAQIIRHGS